MSAPNSETNTSPEIESKPKQIAQPIYAHAVSWTWLVGGLIAIVVLGGAITGMYFLQAQSSATRMLSVVDSLVKESDEYKEEMEQSNDPTVKKEKITESLNKRIQAANLLDQFHRANPENPNELVLTKLYDVLESLYKDYGEGSTPLGLQRGDQLSKLAVDLTQIVSDSDSLKYRKKLLELEWDRRNLPGIIDRGKQLLESARRAGEVENYDALRYIALALFEHLPVGAYNPREYSLPPVFEDELDKLLGKLNKAKPDDIEVAKRYAEFIASVDHHDVNRQRIIRASASDQLVREKKPEDRLAEAKRIVDNMVQRNRDDPAAYLARYHFNAFLVSAGIVPANTNALDQADPDLATVLRLSPSNAEGLILSSLDALRQAQRAADNGEPERAAKWQKDAEDFLHKTVRDNPSDPFGYQYLGDFMLFVRRDPTKAIEAWNGGLANTHHRGDEELIGRLVLVLIEQGMLDEVREKLVRLDRALAEIRVTRPDDADRTRQMRDLLSAQLSNAEANIAASKIDMARRENRSAEVRRLYSVVQAKKGEATQNYEKVLQNWGKDPNHYIFLSEKKSVYNMLLPESLLQLGDLKMDWGEWDSAAKYFERALPIPSAEVQRRALLKLSVAHQQGGRLDEAARALKRISDRYPDDLPVRYAYATLLFRSQIASNAADTETLDTIEKELQTIGQHRSELTQPWAVDIRLIHLGVARANLSNSADTIVEAMKDAARKFRVLEKQTFPPDAEGKVKNYIDDPAFVAELVGIYSSLSELDDFKRLLVVLQAFPEGEDAYYEARINDALRRDDKDLAIAIIDEAGTSTRLSAAKKERFVILLQSLKKDTPDNNTVLETAYNQLKTAFDTAPETLKPQAFFILANMSLDMGNIEQAKQIRERLRSIEGPTGRNWQYVEVRIMLNEKDPDYARMREIQEQIAGTHAGWDMAYILRTLIEEQYLVSNPEDTAVRDKLIESYQAATAAGNTRPDIWQRLVGLLDRAGRTDDAREAIRMAARNGVVLETRAGQFPQPFGRMYSDVQEFIAKEDHAAADQTARECIRLAEARSEKHELVFTLHLALGKVFLDSHMTESAMRHLSETAKRGGTYVYPLAVCMAKAGNVDEGFTLLLNEIDLVPSAMTNLLPAVLVLLAQVQPSETVFERIDRLMGRIERGERLTLRTELEASDEDHIISMGTKYVPSRKIQSLTVRLADSDTELDPAVIQFLSPEELGVDAP